jgi:hypothetical protein
MMGDGCSWEVANDEDEVEDEEGGAVEWVCRV